jgi:hypothetical protein
VASTSSGDANPLDPGAFQVKRTPIGAMQVYRVVVPRDVSPGSEFTVLAGTRRVRARCPFSSKAEQLLEITIPEKFHTNYIALQSAILTDPRGSGGGGAASMSPDVVAVNEAAERHGGTAQTYLVTIPPNIYPGMIFTVNVAGQRFMVNCPESAEPGKRVRIVPPVRRDEPEAAPENQIFEVVVPAGVQNGQSFALVANGQRVQVHLSTQCRARTKDTIPTSGISSGRQYSTCVRIGKIWLETHYSSLGSEISMGPRG